MKHPLDNYLQLITKIDALCRGIEAALGDQISCHERCSSCCTAITLFPVEAAALRYALEGLPMHEAESIRRHVAENATGERCPLLSHHRCLLYNARPVICRTHGLPVTYVENNLHKSDICPLNMTEAESVSGMNVIDLDKLNALLVSVNALYLSQTDATDYPERVTIAEAIAGP